MKYLIFMLFLLPGFALSMVETPTILFNQSLEFTDDMDFKNMDLAITRQLQYFNRRGLEGEIQFGETIYPVSQLKESLKLLKSLYNEFLACKGEECSKTLNLKLNTQFDVYVPISENGTKYTSYYSPDMHGSRIKTERYKNPIYAMPKNANEYTRVDVDFKDALKGQNLEIFWVEESLFDIYLLQVQGGGRIQIDLGDGKTEMKYLSFAGKSNHEFKMIVRYMIQQGYISGTHSSIAHQRKFLNDNPDKQEDVFAQCPSYVYFKESNTEPIGVGNIPLTEGRSLAIDNRIYKIPGLINFVKTSKATKLDENGDAVMTPFSRFFIAQDTGGAIKGNARCDLYFGYGPEAEMIAYNMNEKGEQYFLVKKLKQD